ncbi:enoyl-CoA hydratase [Pasteurella multocida subsp. multocida]|uniref:Enoyl-CoA hydratase n=2 Tax=Pasteurella multocida TaxID=747 RepID=A0A9X3US50_PASMD|nr:enoyl-CoA hydratase [Pasteurella multocida]MBF6981700.1 enoyl-CoA hydratase [Pasteurella multocida]MDA5609357.1 enoyl-CoA hydratase [Pasteurella multocida subsp. multocida]MDA5611857.1 enoyl-CoA hydratase [Pasteurella multocida]MDA5614334.1 enoyl-CoA hydratase [Pasteurella multocida]MDA5616878.1 enoyl-CoA hydratase [Pasteurella multocida]
MMNTRVYLALYKGKKSGRRPKDFLARFSDWLTRKFTKGIYSHCEIVVRREEFLTGHHYEVEVIHDCYSSSIRDGGVRCKQIDVYDREKWDLIELKNIKEEQIKRYFESTKGLSYDWWGALGIVLGLKQKRSKFFCSEWCFNCIKNSDQGWRFTPNQLAVIFKEVK